MGRRWLVPFEVRRLGEWGQEGQAEGPYCWFPAVCNCNVREDRSGKVKPAGRQTGTGEIRKLACRDD